MKDPLFWTPSHKISLFWTPCPFSERSCFQDPIPWKIHFYGPHLMKDPLSDFMLWKNLFLSFTIKDPYLVYSQWRNPPFLGPVQWKIPFLGFMLWKIPFLGFMLWKIPFLGFLCGSVYCWPPWQDPLYPPPPKKKWWLVVLACGEQLVSMGP